MTKVVTIKIENARYQNMLASDLERLNSQYPKITIRKYRSGEKLQYVVKVKFRYEIGTNASNVAFYTELEMKINMSKDVVNVHEVERFINELRKNTEKVIEELCLDEMSVDTKSVLMKIMELINEKLIYEEMEPNIQLKMNHVGGDYPFGNFELIYYA